MSDEEEDVRLKKSHFYWYDGKPVLVQLREPWFGVTYPNDPVMNRDRETGEVTGVVSVPFLKGILHVHPDGNDVMFVLETTDPNPNESAMAYIALKKEDVAYITFLQRRLVEA